jgi:formate hydrogenlyase subunit 3/multisubunit Na+/H+ antiporter MnhD subunit
VTTAGALLAFTLALPLAMLLACLSPQLRNRMPELLALAPLPALAAALFAANGSSLVLSQALLGLTLVLDTPGRMLLGAAALLWMAAGAYAGVYLRGSPNGGSFAVWWLMTLTGSVGIFIAADMIGFYLFYTLVSLAAYGLVVYDGSSAARRAASINVALAILGEAFLLMAFILLAAAAPGGSLLIRDAVAALSTSPWRDPALTLLILGFGLKIGSVLLHIWMPLTYSAAPIPAAAVLSGAAVKAGVIGLIRFLPFDVPLPVWGEIVVAVGLISAFYGVAIGITQANPKTILAYSSISQMGLIAAVLGMGLAAGDRSVSTAAAFYAVHHVFVKGGLFLAIGVAALSKQRRLWSVLLPAAVLALGLGGLPLTGGALAKLAVKAPLGDGFVGLLAMLSAAASTLLMTHFLRRLAATTGTDSTSVPSTGVLPPWLATAFAAVAVPWVLFSAAGIGSLAEALSPAAIWSALWPVLIGLLLAVGLRRWERWLPRVPEGDVVVLAERAARAALACGGPLERAESALRHWPIAGLSLLAVALMLGAALFVR